jgi:PAS domain S-box-containing protein
VLCALTAVSVADASELAGHPRAGAGSTRSSHLSGAITGPAVVHSPVMQEPGLEERNLRIWSGKPRSEDATLSDILSKGAESRGDVQWGTWGVLLGVSRMKDGNKTKQQLIAELEEMRERVAEAELLGLQRGKLHEARAQSEGWHGIAGWGNVAGVACADVQGRITYVNEALCAMVGHDIHEVLGRPFADFVDADDERRLQRVSETSLQGESSAETLEFRAVRKDGRRVWCQCIPVRLAPGTAVEQFVGIFLDVTGPKEMEEALRQSERRFGIALESALDGILIMDFDGVIVEVNTACVAALGCGRKEELIGRKATEVLSPRAQRERGQKQLDEDRRAWRFGKGYLRNLERVVVRRDGTEMPVELNLSRLTDEDGRTTGAIAIVRNVSERKRAEEALRASEERYRLVVENASEGIVVLQDEVVKFANPAASHIMGHSREELAQVPFIEFVHPDDLELAPARFRSWLRLRGVGPPLFGAFRLVDRDGNTRWVEVNAVRIDWDDRPATLGFVTNITDRVQAEQELLRLAAEEERLRRELEAELARKTRFVHGLVHQLKTPLTPVLASSELLAGELHDEPLVSLARNVYRGACAVEKTVDALLQMARGEAGILRLRSRRMDLLQLVRGVATDMTPVAARRGQSLLLELPEALLPVWGDQDRLYQVLLNLVENAVESNGEGGQVTMRVQQTADSVVVEVEDTGDGMSMEEQEHAFEPYWQVERSGARGRGLGLGLPLSKLLVELHGGRIWSEGHDRQRCTIGFSLPLGGDGEAGGRDAEAGHESPRD